MKTCSELLQPSRALRSVLYRLSCRAETIREYEKRFRLQPAFVLDVYSRRDRRLPLKSRIASSKSVQTNQICIPVF